MSFFVDYLMKANPPPELVGISRFHRCQDDNLIPIIMKKCNCCGEFKRSDEFHFKWRYERMEFYSYCIKCTLGKKRGSRKEGK